VASADGRDLGFAVAWADVEGVHQPFGRPLLTPPVHRPQPVLLGVREQVLPSGERRGQASGLTVAGNLADPLLPRPSRMRRPVIGAVQPNEAAVEAMRTEHGVDEFEMAGVSEAGDGDDLTGSHVEIDRSEAGAAETDE